MSESQMGSQMGVAVATPYGRTDGLTENQLTYQPNPAVPYRTRAYKIIEVEG